MNYKRRNNSEPLVLLGFALSGMFGLYLFIDGLLSSSGASNTISNSVDSLNTVGNVVSALENETDSASDTGTTTSTSTEEVVSVDSDPEVSEPLPEDELVVLEVSDESEDVQNEEDQSVQPAIKEEEEEINEESNEISTSTDPAPPAVEVSEEIESKLIEGAQEIHFQATANDISKSVRATLIWNVTDETSECRGNWTGEVVAHTDRQEIYFNKPGLYEFALFCKKGSAETLKTVNVLVRDSAEKDYAPDGLAYYFVDSETRKIIHEGAQGVPRYIAEKVHFDDEQGTTVTWRLKNDSKVHSGIVKVVLRVHFDVLNSEAYERFLEVLEEGERLGELQERDLEYVGYMEKPSGGKTLVFEHTAFTKAIPPRELSEEFEFNFGSWATSTDVGIHKGEMAWFKVHASGGKVFVND